MPEPRTLAFRAPQEALHAALRAAGRAVAARPLQPVLGGLLLRAEGSLVTVEGYDLSVGVAVSLPAAVEQAGAAVIPAHPTLELIGRLPAGSMVSVAIGDAAEVAIEAPGVSYTVPGAVAAEDWPGLPVAGDAATTVELPLGALQEALGRVSHAVAPEGEGKGVAEGVSLVLGASGELRLLGCSGTRASLALLPGLEAGGATLDVVIPRALARELERLGGDGEAMAVLRVDAAGRMLAVEAGGRRVAGNLLDGAYPPVAKLFEGDPPHSVVVDSKELAAALERAAVFGGSVGLTIGEGSVTVSVSGDTGTGGERVAASGFDGKASLLANPKLLLDGLHVLPGGPVRVLFTGPDRPILLRPVSAGLQQYLVMPISKKP